MKINLQRLSEEVWMVIGTEESYDEINRKVLYTGAYHLCEGFISSLYGN